jgi:hypothetical protein
MDQKNGHATDKTALADLILLAQLGHRLAPEALDNHHRFGLGIPFPALHG